MLTSNFIGQFNHDASPPDAHTTKLAGASAASVAASSWVMPASMGVTRYTTVRRRIIRLGAPV